MRLFLAVELPENVQETLHRGLGILKRDQPPARWVRSEGIHVTLKFLGELPETAVAELGSAVPAALAPLAPVEIRLGGGGFFPQERHPRVAWIGGEAPGLERWAAALEEVGELVGVARERRPFALHLTLARLERPWGAQAVEHFKVQTGKWQLAPFVAREVVLFSSELKPSGSVYTALGRSAVGGA
jgi:RNA 2',3'-cyclic 3'-phosphodiesterase